MISPLEVSAAAETMGFELPAPAVEKLAAFASELATKGPELGLVARSDARNVLGRHVLDSLRATRALREGDRVALDLGSGGGLPGIPLAVARPELRVVLVEARRLRAAWLELQAERLALPNVSVVHGRIEEVREGSDLCLARALGSLEASWELARPLLRPGGRLAYFGGEGFEAPAEGLPGGKLHIQDEPGLDSPGPLVIIARE